MGAATALFADVSVPHRRQGRAGSLSASLLVHAFAVAALVTATGASTGAGRAVIEAIKVEFRSSPPPPPPPPAAHRPAKAAARAPIRRQLSPVKPLLQPVEAPRAIEPPAPQAEEADEEDDGVEGGSPGGVEGGVVGGSGPVTAVAPEPPPKPAPQIFDRTMTPPRLLSGPNPEYTPEAKSIGVEGLMVVKCVITAAGDVRECRVVKGLPYMDAAVIRAFEARRYTPALSGGQPIEVEYIFTVRLRLER